jgi:hypothetical protein
MSPRLRCATHGRLDGKDLCMTCSLVRTSDESKTLFHHQEKLALTFGWLISRARMLQVLRKINPLEASILRDPTLHARLRFRFGGGSFPPVILYKIFINANVQVRVNALRG